MFKVLPGPEFAIGYYPQREDRLASGWLQRVGEYLSRCFNGFSCSRMIDINLISRWVEPWAETYARQDKSEIQKTVAELRYLLKQKGLTDPLIGQAFALIRETAERTVGMRHFDVQLLGGWIMLRGMIAEMNTGEGKTLTATLPACTAAILGVPVHIVTVNDYLAERDAGLMSPIYNYLGLSVGVINEQMDTTTRRENYLCDIVYCTNKRIAFDYLNDRLQQTRTPGRLLNRLACLLGGEVQQPLLRGLSFAIVDEADSVFIDEAVTPLIISKSVKASERKRVLGQALTIAEQMVEGRDFNFTQNNHDLEITTTGELKYKKLMENYEGVWRNGRYQHQLISQALKALHLFHKDKHYLLTDEGVKIIDEFTGRVMPDRSWEQGLHQLIELKEGCELTDERETIGRISYQRFWRRYRSLSGMTGTAKESRAELRNVYNLHVYTVPTNKPVIRKRSRGGIFTCSEEKWQAIVDAIADSYQRSRPVLIGTRSVAASEHLSSLLTQRGIPHQVLNAKHDGQEAEIVSRAGKAGQITVATNMAGRGTDIKLQQGVPELGGLHVISAEYNESARIDRQLYGRCGRQGDPGTYEAFASLDDDLLVRYAPKGLLKLAERVLVKNTSAGRRLAVSLIRQAQFRAQRRSAKTRRQLLRLDEYLNDALSFSGRLE